MEDQIPLSKTTERSGSTIIQTGKMKSPNNKLLTRFFWIAILTLAAVSISLTVAGTLHNSQPKKQEKTEFDKTIFEKIFTSVPASEALLKTTPNIGPRLEEVYAPVYQSIPLYADFHYSVLGEYVELKEFAFDQMNDGLKERLFHGFEQRLSSALTSLDKSYAEEYQIALRQQIERIVPAEQLLLPIGDLTLAILQDAVDRSTVTAPLAGTAAGIIGSGTLRIAATTIAKKIAAKVVAKGVAKGAIKGGSILAGAGTGALLCSWTGPGAAICGLVGGTAAWFLTDSVVINIDEYFNREDFEAELSAFIDDDKAKRRNLIEKALQNKAVNMIASSKEIVEDFTLRDLSSGD